MKKIALLTLALFLILSTSAQKKMVSTAQSALEKGELDKAWEAIQAAKDNDETKALPKTWFVRGQILQAIGKSTDSKYTALFENPIVEAYSCYQKAIDLDPKKRINKEVDLQLIELSTIAINKAITEFNIKRFDKALDLFELELSIETSPIYKNKIDTPMIFNCGLAAFNSKQYDKAIDYFKKAAFYNYNGGSIYSLIGNSYLLKGDTANAIAIILKGNELYPNEISTLVDLINIYLRTGESQEALNFLNKAKEKEPNNASFSFAEGTLYEKMGQPDKAVISYTNATEVDPNYYDAYYNLGVIYYNKAVKENDSATSENDNNKYQELIKKRDQELKTGLPYMEKAHLINPKADDAAKSLRSFYMQLLLNDKLNQLKQEMGW